jgi:AraC-like DNA-binding protein
MVFWEGASLWILGTRPGADRYPRTEAHAHHAVQATFALRGDFELATPTGKASGPAAIVAPDTEHTFEGTELIAHLFIDPDSRVGRAVRDQFLSDAKLANLPPTLLRDLLVSLTAAFEDPDRTDAELIELGRMLVARLGGAVEGRPPDIRVRRMVAFVLARVAEPVVLGDAATAVGLSAGRARHLFVEQTGLPFRTFLLWLRLMKAVEAYAGGGSLTEAAHATGFSDSAHLSRTFRRMFGIAAVTLRVD